MDRNIATEHPVRDFLIGRRRNPYVSETERAVLEIGRIFVPTSRPAAFVLGKPQDCFVNAGDMAIADPKFGTYVEGFAASDDQPPFHHAWLTLDGETAIDVTLRDTTGYSFFGIEFPAEFVLKWVCRRRFWGLLRPFDAALIEDFKASYPRRSR